MPKKWRELVEKTLAPDRKKQATERARKMLEELNQDVDSNTTEQKENG